LKFGACIIVFGAAIIYFGGEKIICHRKNLPSLKQKKSCDRQCMMMLRTKEEWQILAKQILEFDLVLNLV
jgi:hypothetical protein